MRPFIDRSMKALALRYPEAFVRVALPGMEGLSVEAIENPEVNVPEKRLDFVYKVSSRDGKRLLHLEFQLEHQSDLPKRMFTYNALLTESQKVPVISAVIYLERRDYAALPDEYAVTLEGRALNRFSYQVVRLWEYEDEIRSGDLPELAPLLPLLSRKKDEEVLSKTRELVLKTADPKWRPDALSIAITVAARYFKKEFLLQFFKEEMAMLQEASIVQDWINQGMEKGQRIGELRTMRADILDVLTERFGPAKQLGAIGAALEAIDDPTVLRSLLRQSAKATSLDEFAKLAESLAGH